MEEEKKKENDEEEDNSAFECNICFDQPTQPVVTSCGHLYCWRCIYLWIHSGRSAISCPVCKADISAEKIIPIYGKGGNKEDPRNTIPQPEQEPDIPPRPIPQRTEHAQAQHHNNPFPGFHGAHFQTGGFTFSAGVGPVLFPFQMNFGANNGPLTPQQEREMQNSRLFMLLAFLVLTATIFLS